MRIENAAIQLAYLKSTGMNRAEKERKEQTISHNMCEILAKTLLLC